MTVTDLGATADNSSKTSLRSGLSSLVLTELRSLAGELGIRGTSGMRKGDLIAAIEGRQAGSQVIAHRTNALKGGAPAAKTASAKVERVIVVPAVEPVKATVNASSSSTVQVVDPKVVDPKVVDPIGSGEKRRTEAEKTGTPVVDTPVVDTPATDTSVVSTSTTATPEGGNFDNRRGRQRNRTHRDGNRDNQNRDNSNRDSSSRDNSENSETRDGQQTRTDNRNDRGESDETGRRGRRFRERRRGRDRDGNGDPQISEDDVLQPVAGILDVLDNYAFVRTSGYLAGPNDVYVSMNLVRKNGLRRGDAVTGAVRVSREGETVGNQRQKFNPLVRLDTVNGTDIETAKARPDFAKLTPLYPNERLRLETTPERLTTRVIDLIMPIGKGQRALIVSPPKAGKTLILQDIANAISINNPECYLMVVLVDERPEEVTDMQRSVKGEVIASTFDRPPTDHTSVAELAIERAKRIVETGRDVVVLLDSITRLGRAYNNASPASGRILSGGVDSTALYPPKRFLGAARNIENGGSLTIIATALVETGSTGDTVIFEEFKGTGNAELKLDRKIAERRVFPAVDVNPSATRKDELLLAPEEFSVVHKLRRILSGLDSHQAIDLLISQLKKSKTNLEFLMQVQKNSPGGNDDSNS